MENTPAKTVGSKLFVKMAIRHVGMAAANTVQFIASPLFVLASRFSTINPVKMQMGI